MRCMPARLFGVFVATTALLVGGCASWRPAVVPEASHAIEDGEQTSLARELSEHRPPAAPPSGFRVLASGFEALVARLELTDAATRTLDLQYYSAQAGLSTDLLLLRLHAAARRGVRIRIVLDDIFPPSREFARRASALHAAIQVRLFSPFFAGADSSVARAAEFAFDGERLNRRMHNKLWITDNAAAIVGSRNLGDEYFDLDETANFADAELLAAGPIVREMSRAFDEYWNSASAVPLQALLPAGVGLEDVQQLAQLRARIEACADRAPCSWRAEEGILAALRSGAKSLAWAPAIYFHDAPDGEDKREPASSIEHGFAEDDPRGARTERELLIVSPYFIPSENGLRHLRTMREAGVRVAVLTSSLAATDSVAAHAGYARHRLALVRAGVELHEARATPGSPHRRSHRWGHTTASALHAKIIVQDRRRATVGSPNQDPRSRIHNTEGWLTLESDELARDLAALFEEGTSLQHSYRLEAANGAGSCPLVWTIEQDGRVVTDCSEPGSSLWLRAWRSLLGVFVPEHML